MSTTNDCKALHEIQGQTARLGTHTAVEGGASSEENRNHEIRKQKFPEVVETCEDCV